MGACGSSAVKQLGTLVWRLQADKLLAVWEGAQSGAGMRGGNHIDVSSCTTVVKG